MTDAPNHPRPVDHADGYGYKPYHDEQQSCLGCGKTVTFDADMNCWWIPYDVGNPPRGTFDCTDRVMVRHMGSLPRLNPSLVGNNPLLRAIADMVSYMDLHIGKYQISQFTSEQKEMWADLSDAASVLLARDDPTMDPPGRTPRWWRSDYAGPTGPDHPGWDDLDREEPDPFRGADYHFESFRSPKDRLTEHQPSEDQPTNGD